MIKTRTPVEASISNITVPTNRLRELRDVEGLVESISEIGLLHPITVTESGVLVSGRHRLEAVKRLGWETIPAFVVEDDELSNRLLEIDENLQRLDLTVWEQAKHAEERERVLDALGQRVHPKPQTDRDALGRFISDPAPSAGSGSAKKTRDISREAGMSERTWQNRTKIGREIGEETAAVLDHADVTDEKQRNLLNSTTQLDHLANIARKHGDEEAARVAERALSEDGGNTFKAYEEIKNERASEAATSASNGSKEEEGLEGEALEIVALERAGKTDIVVRWSDGTKNAVPKKRVLEETRFTRCKCCKGLGVVDKNSMKEVKSE